MGSVISNVQATSRADANRDSGEYRTVDLRKYVVTLWRKRSFLYGAAALGLVAGIATGLLMHPAYDATVRLMPPSERIQSALSLLITSAAKNSGDQYLGLITSRTVADDVIEHQHLAEYFHTTRPSKLRALLDSMSKIKVDKNQFVTVTIRAKEPETAMRIANEFPAALYRLNHEVAQAQAEHRWQYYEAPLEQEKNHLAQAEEALTLAQQKTGMVLPQAQVQVSVGAIAELKQQITAKQAQLAALETGSTAENPKVVQLRSEIASLNAEMHRLEAQSGGTNASPITAKLPEQSMEILRAQREVKYHETLFEILSKQAESARIEESYSPPIELVDKAVLPDRKSWPPRILFALLGFLLGGMLGCVTVVLQILRPISQMRQMLEEYQSGNGDELRS
jgi:uncharacterized protein involved in exopolysaccharide biosynthesis